MVEEEERERGAPKIRDDRLINYVPVPGKAFLPQELRDGRNRGGGWESGKAQRVTTS